MEHDSPGLLFELACEHLRSSRLVRPGPVRLVERVAAAREAAKAETFSRVEHLLTARLTADLDALLVVDDELGATGLQWLGAGATQALLTDAQDEDFRDVHRDDEYGAFRATG